MRKIDDGGLAFVHLHVSVDNNGQPLRPNEMEKMQIGLTLRDWFAGQSLANLYTHSEQSPDKAAEWAYQLADAMIAARKGDKS